MKKKSLIMSLLFLSTLSFTSCSVNNSSKQSLSNSTNDANTSYNSATSDIATSNSTSKNQTTSSTQTSSVQSATSSSTSEIPGGYEMVNSILDVSNDCTVGTAESDIINGPFTIVKGTEVRSRTKSWENPENSSDTKSFTQSIKIGNKTSTLKVTSNGQGTLDIYVQNGSSGVETRTVIFTKEGGGTTELKIPGSAVSPDFPNYPSGSPVTKVSIPVTEGTYTIGRDSGTIDIYYAELNVLCEKATVTGFEVSNNGTVDYVEGETYDSSKVALNLVYGNGRRDPLPLSEVNIDTSNVNMNVPGVYNVIVNYNDFTSQSIEITVYELDSITLGFNRMAKGANNSSGNTCYINNHVKQVYAKGETLNHDNLTVTANCKHPSDKTTKDFIMNESYYTVESKFNSNVEGTYAVNVTLSINGKSKDSSYNVHVVSTSPVEINSVLSLKVDKNYKGTIGAALDGYNQFSNIQQALDYIENLGTDYDAKEKVITISAGTYTEKLEIDIPNLTLQGEDKETTIIEWDSLYGIKDESGFENVTDSTQSVAIRDKAINCQIKGITISNWFNCEEHFSERFGENYAEHRALALLVQADKFIMDDCKLIGYQDTVEFFTGRQLIKNTYISGTTDFIFGTNNTTYFYQCEIHSIENAKSNGGYITAFKGCNKGDNDSIKYGAIFDSCNFTADAKVISLAKTSIGRCWGKYASVMIMNSQMAGHISKNPSSGNTKDERYVSMNANPTDATVQFTEYNNTGDGAISETISGMRLLESEEASNYNNLSVIFNTTNGNLTYSEAWNIAL